jgi:hypothetical protein
MIVAVEIVAAQFSVGIAIRQIQDFDSNVQKRLG